MKIIIEIDGCKCEVESNGENLSDAIQLFEQALRGVGFCFDGKLDILDDE